MEIVLSPLRVSAPPRELSCQQKNFIAHPLGGRGDAGLSTRPASDSIQGSFMNLRRETIGVAWGLILIAGWLAGITTRAAEPRLNPTAATNLVAWCIVPFDTVKRGPEERAVMLERLGITQLAYDWRAEHIPTFDDEVAALARHKIHLRAWWFPATLNSDAEAILACIRRNHLHPELWVMSGEPAGTNTTSKVNAAAEGLRAVVKAAADLGCKVGLYNHGGWFGEPENQLAIRARLAELGFNNVGLVYNFHHGHDHLDRLPAIFPLLVPHLLAVNFNGMTRDGERLGRKIIPFGSGEYDTAILQLVRNSGYAGPVGILGHTMEDAEGKLRQDLAGLHKVEARLAAGEAAPWPAPGPKREIVPAVAPLAAAATPAVGASRPKETAPAVDRTPGMPKVSGQEPGSQKEQDWVDDRWSHMDVGPAFASNLHLPDGSVIAKALTLQLPGEGRHCVAYDLATGTLRAAWSGGFLKFDASRFGLMGGQKPAMKPWFVNPSKAGFPGAKYRFLGMRRSGSRVLLEHEVNGAKLQEIVTVLGTGTTPQLVRHFSAEGVTAPLSISVGRTPEGAVEEGQTGSLKWLRTAGATDRVRLGIDGAAVLRRQANGAIWAELAPGAGRQLFGILLSADPGVPPITAHALNQDPKSILKPADGSNPTVPLILTTRGQRGADTDILAVDTLTMPYENPAHALMFASGVDLTPEGIAYVCTMHGDVWKVSGIDDSLRELKWTRFATGLFQPLGLKVREGQIYVLGRDRITCLMDTNGDGVADAYENFHDAIATSTGGHDYVTCLEQDMAGNFYYVDPLGLHRVSSTGRETALLAGGFRNPNGMGVSPDGRVLTVAPQQGNRTPSSGIWEIPLDTPGFWGGYPEPRIASGRPEGYDAPLCWIPHGVDNSSGSQVWVPAGQWGPLGGQMLHLLWGRCGLMMTLRDAGDGRRNGAVVPLPAKFLAGPNRGSFHGNALYVAGSTGWQTSAVSDGSLQRVRWTGKRFLQPVAWEARREGLDLTFAEPLRRDTATDVGSYSVKRWNYRYAAQYGSKDWSFANPGKEGRDEVNLLEARLSGDGRTVSLRTGPLSPVMQFEIKYNLDTADGKPVKGSLWGTVNPAGERRDFR